MVNAGRAQSGAHGWGWGWTGLHGGGAAGLHGGGAGQGCTEVGLDRAARRWGWTGLVMYLEGPGLLTIAS